MLLAVTTNGVQKEMYKFLWILLIVLSEKKNKQKTHYSMILIVD
jgi:hypothetical protein